MYTFVKISVRREFIMFPTFQYTQTCWMFQIWDRRHGDHPVKQVPIHSGPVYFCDWHPDNEHWILSAGRDKMIKVREM